MRILVVDRQEELRGALNILEMTPGNEIKSASTGEEALAVAAAEHIDLMITEVIMEPMNGFTLRNKMENRYPGVKTIFLSGYDLSPYKEHTEGYEIVAKPATAQKLFPAIARAMAGGAAAPQPVAPVAKAAPAPVSAAAVAPAAAPKPVPATAQTATQLPFPSPDFASVAAAPAVVPKATPAAKPVLVQSATLPPAAAPVAAPKVTPAPAATPVAGPMATPAATPLAVPKAAPAPEVTPVAVPMATPAAQVATPLAVPKATPAPTPVAVPKATAAAAPLAAPKAAPGPNPVAVPRATAFPAAAGTKATPAGAPKATPTLPKTPWPVRTTVPLRPAAEDSLLGRTLGSYRIERRLGQGKWGPVYLATQTSMNRPVAMELLDSEKAGDETARQNFVATARAKAAVAHPHILSVYEADQAEGFYFYTHQYVDGSTLAQLAVRGEGLSEPLVLQTIKCVGQGLAHLHHHKIGHAIPDATDIYIGTDGLPYLSNVAQPGAEMPVAQEEICVLATVVRSVLPGGHAQDTGLNAMLNRMAIATQSGFQSWAPLFQAIQAIEPKVVPVDAFKLSAQDEAAIRAVEEARKRQKTVVSLSIAGLCVFLLVLASAVYWEFFRAESQAHDYSDQMVEIPAGDFIFQNGQKVTLPTFYIDKYEVTMGEYKKFLDYLSKNGNPTTYDSPLQPPGRTHVPHNWDIYYGRASASLPSWRTVHGMPVTLDCPVFNVDYFDAYAYAKWKGRRLPTEQEWEKAARGTNGNAYPWGNEWDPQKLNAGTDYEADPTPGYKPAVDGYNAWAPVAALPTDSSAYGVIGMAGNVSEWTNTWDAGKTYVVIKGGNFKSNSEQAKLTSEIKTYPENFAETLGFRTASDTPPAGK